MIKTRFLVCSIVLMLLVVGCSKSASNDYVIPSEYSHAKSMLDSFSKNGIKIQEISNSNLMAVFHTKPNYAMFIKTDSAAFELIHLENKNGKDFTITTKSADGRFKYIVRNGADEQLYDAKEETFFSKNDAYITFTTDKQLNEKIHKILQNP